MDFLSFGSCDFIFRQPHRCAFIQYTKVFLPVSGHFLFVRVEVAVCFADKLFHRHAINFSNALIYQDKTALTVFGEYKPGNIVNDFPKVVALHFDFLFLC